MQSPEVALIVGAIQNVNENVTDIRQDMRDLRRDMNDKIDEVIKSQREHEEKDSAYWKQIDERQGQLMLIKGLTFSSFGLWVWQYFADRIGLR